MSDMIEMTLYGGPMDGSTIEFNKHNLQTKPMIGVQGEDGEMHTYGLDNNGTFVWIPDPSDPKVQRGIFVFDDDGALISEEPTIEDALRKMQELEDDYIDPYLDDEDDDDEDIPF